MRPALASFVPAALAAALALACATPGPRPAPGEPGEAAAREILGRFARALDEGRFAEAHGLLSRRWRATYTPGRLALDFAGAGPVAGEAARRVLAGLSAGTPLARDGEGRVRLPLEGGRAALLVAEADGWRVDAIE